MEYRETPRIAATEGRKGGVIDGTETRRRLRRFDFAGAKRHLDFPRVVIALLLAAAAIAMLGYLGVQAARSAIRWLHHQPQYQLRFLDIELAAPPPDWFRGGTEGFLKQVRENAGEAEVLKIMELDQDQIENDFKLYPWVDLVSRVDYPPQAIKVHLVYKTPVATIPFSPAAPSYLDKKGQLLPARDIDSEKLGLLIPITGKGLEQASAENRPGRVWRSSAPGAEAERLKRCVLGACRLAGFLREPQRTREAASFPALRIVAIYATDERGLFLQNSEKAMIFWGQTPGEETNGNLEAKDKWDILERWAKSPSRRNLPPGDYWMFSPPDLEPAGARGSGP
jgi:hypothetical protein